MQLFERFHNPSPKLAKGLHVMLFVFGEKGLQLVFNFLRDCENFSELLLIEGLCHFSDKVIIKFNKLICKNY